MVGVTEPDVEKMGCVTNGQQHLLLIMRMRDGIEGQKGQEQYKGIYFYRAIKPLIQAGWVRRKIGESRHSNNRPSSTYVLTAGGYRFIAEMIKFPAYAEFRNKYGRTWSVG